MKKARFTDSRITAVLRQAQAGTPVPFDGRDVRKMVSPSHRVLFFPGQHLPKFADFCSFAFVIGMTCQVSDVAVETSYLRRVVTFHGILAFSFNLGVLALTINVLAGFL